MRRSSRLRRSPEVEYSGMLSAVENGEVIVVLRHGKPVAEICFACGFGTMSNFYQRFRVDLKYVDIF